MSVRIVKASSLLPSPGHRAGEAPFPFGLGQTGVHEVAEAAHGDAAAATGFALSALKKAPPASLLWISDRTRALEHGKLLGRSLNRWLGTMPPCLIVETTKPAHLLWALEEALRSRAVSLVMAEGPPPDFTASRRLTLAAREFGTPAILLLPYRTEGATAAEARWRVSAAPSAPNPYDRAAPGEARWQATLERCRPAPGQVGRTYLLDKDHEPISCHHPHRLAADPLAPQPANDGGPRRRTG